MNEIMSIVTAAKTGKAVVSATGKIVFVRDAGGEVSRETARQPLERPLPLAA